MPDVVTLLKVSLVLIVAYIAMDYWLNSCIYREINRSYIKSSEDKKTFLARVDSIYPPR